MKKNNKWLGKVTFVISAIMIAMLIMTNVAFAADVSGTYSYASLCATDYTYTSGQTGSVGVSGDTFTLKAKGTNATNGGLCSSATPAVACTTTLTIIPNCDVKITATAGTGSKVTASGVNLGVETQVKGGTKVTFSVTASDGTEVKNTLKVTLTADDTNNYPSDCATYSILNGDGKTYYYLDEAIEAIPNGGTIVVGTTGTVYHSNHENGTKIIDIPAGVILLLPRMPGETTVTGAEDLLQYANYDVWNKDSVSSLSTTDTNRQNVVLTIPSGMTINNNGKIILGGSIASYSSYFSGGTQSQSNYYDHDASASATETAHKHSDIKLNGTINMGSNSVLSAIGFITGSGTINANTATGAKIYQPFMIADYRGGNYVAGAGGKYGGLDYTVDTGVESIISPFVRYTMQNIQTTIKMKSGNYMYGYCDMWASSQHNLTTACIIGDNNEEGLVKLTDGATLTAKYQNSNKVKHYDAFVDGDVNDGTRGGINGWGYNQIGRTKLTITGGASLGNMSLDVKIGNSQTVTMNMKDVTFPLPYNYDIYLNAASGETAMYSIPYSMQLLPGASITVGTGATLSVGDGSNDMRFMVMDGLFDHTKHGESKSYGSAPTVTSTYRETTDYTYPKTGELQAAGLSGTAVLKLNGGKLVVNSNVMFGGLVQASGESGEQVIFNGTNGCTTRIGLVGKNDLRFAVAGATDRTLPARLMNCAGEYVEMVPGKVYKSSEDNDNVIKSYSFDLYTTSSNTNTKTSYTEISGKVCDNCATCKLAYGSEAARCVCNIFSDIPVSGMWYDYTLTVKEDGKDDVIYYHLNNKLYTADGEVTNHIIPEGCGAEVTIGSGVEVSAEGTILTFSNVALTEDVVVTVNTPCDHSAVVETPEVPATCDSPGTKAYWTCECGKSFADAEATIEIENLDIWKADEEGGLIPATGHSFAYVKLESVAQTYNSYQYTCSCGSVGTFDDMMAEVGYQVQTLPEGLDFCAQGNLWDLFDPDEKYFYFGGTNFVPSWDDTYKKGDALSVTIPVQEGMKIYANSFETSHINTSGYAGAFVTFYIQDENGEWTAQAWSREYVYKLVVTDKLGYITVPEGAVYANISHYKGIQSPVLLINHIYEKGSTSNFTTPYSCTTCNDVPSTMEEFQLLGGFTLQQLPENFGDGRNLWESFIKDEAFYYVSSKNASPAWNGVRGKDDMQAITFAVTPETQIYATSFQAEAGNGTIYVNETTVRDGTWVTYFMNNGTTVQMEPSATYSEYNSNGYITVPENAVGVQIAFYNNENVPVNQELKILSHSHSYDTGVVTIDPTCTEKGEKTYTCACGDSYTEEMPTIDHSYNEEHVCSGCGKQDIFDIYASNISVEDGLDLYFYVEKAKLHEDEEYYAVVNKKFADGYEVNGTAVNQITENISFNEWEDYNDELMRFCFSDISAKEMTDTITATVYFADGDDTKTDIAASNTKEESIETYVVRTLDNLETDNPGVATKVKTALVDLVVYGASCQEHFSYNTSDLAEVGDTYSGYASTQMPEYENTPPSGTNFVAASVSAQNKLMYTFYFSGITAEQVEGLTATVTYTDWVDGSEIQLSISGNEFYKYPNADWYGVDIKGLSMVNGYQNLKCVVTDTEGTIIAEGVDSIAGYVARAAEEDAQAVYTALISFVDSACTYFDSLRETLVG